MEGLAVLALGLFIAACSETPPETPTMDAPPVAFNEAETGPPLESGIVTRGETIVALFDFDPSNARRILVGISIEDYCSFQFEFDVVAWQDVDLGDDRIVQIRHGEVNLTVWDDGGFDTCTNYTAAGRGEYASTDNDFFAFLRNETRKNANAFGRQASGLLTTAAGTTVEVDYAHRYVYFPNGDVKEKSHIDLTY